MFGNLSCICFPCFKVASYIYLVDLLHYATLSLIHNFNYWTVSKIFPGLYPLFSVVSSVVQLT